MNKVLANKRTTRGASPANYHQTTGDKIMNRPSNALLQDLQPNNQIMSDTTTSLFQFLKEFIASLTDQNLKDFISGLSREQMKELIKDINDFKSEQ